MASFCIPGLPKAAVFPTTRRGFAEIGFVLHSRPGWGCRAPAGAPHRPGAAGLPMTHSRSCLGDERAPRCCRPGTRSGRETPCLVPGTLGLFLQTPSGGQFTPKSFSLHHFPFMAAPHELALFRILASQGRRSPPPPGRCAQIGFVLHSRPGRAWHRGNWLRLFKTHPGGNLLPPLFLPST